MALRSVARSSGESEDRIRGHSLGDSVAARLVCANIGGIRDHWDSGRFVIRRTCNREVGESGDADRRRLSDGSDGRLGNCGWLWDGDRFE